MLTTDSTEVIIDHRKLGPLFWQVIGRVYNTRLVMSGAEPSYHPATAHSAATINYAHGFFASAFHEIAHWCIAGRKRRLLRDFGYWYEPDGRSLERQQVFEQVEVAPQALELLFHQAAGTQFHASTDNLTAGPAALVKFQQRVYERANQFMVEGLPKRPRLWCEGLRHAREHLVCS